MRIHSSSGTRTRTSIVEPHPICDSSSVYHPPPSISHLPPPFSFLAGASSTAFLGYGQLPFLSFTFPCPFPFRSRVSFLTFDAFLHNDPNAPYDPHVPFFVSFSFIFIPSAFTLPYALCFFLFSSPIPVDPSIGCRSLRHSLRHSERENMRFFLSVCFSSPFLSSTLIDPSIGCRSLVAAVLFDIQKGRTCACGSSFLSAFFHPPPPSLSIDLCDVDLSLAPFVGRFTLSCHMFLVSH